MQVKLYTNDCPRCHVLEKKLNDKHITFTKETDKLRYLVESGFRSYPVLEVDGKMMEFISATRWVNSYTGVR